MKKFNWKPILVIVLALCLAVTMFACKPKEPEAAPQASMATQAIDDIFAALGKTLPKSSKDSANIAVGAKIKVESDFVINRGDKKLIGWSEDKLNIELGVDANFSKTAADNAAKISLRSDNLDVLTLYTKNNIVYIKDDLKTTKDVAATGKYKVDASVLDFTGDYITKLPSTIGALLGGINVDSLKETVNSLLVDNGLSDVIDSIVDAKITTAADNSKVIDLHLITVSEGDGKEGLVGAGLTTMLDGMLGSLLGEVFVNSSMVVNSDEHKAAKAKGEELVGLVNKVLPYILGADLKGMSTLALNKANTLDITVNVDAAGLLSGLVIKLNSGSASTLTKGGLTLTISDLKLSETKNAAIVDYDVTDYTNTAAAKFDVKLDLGNNDLDMSATFEVAPALADSSMKIKLSSVSLKTPTATFDANDLKAEYREVSTGVYGIYVDLLALYKAAYTDSTQFSAYKALPGNSAKTVADFVTATEANGGLGLKGTQYYYQISIGEFITNLYNDKYCLVGYAGTHSHGVFEYLWLDKTAEATWGGASDAYSLTFTLGTTTYYLKKNTNTLYTDAACTAGALAIDAQNVFTVGSTKYVRNGTAIHTLTATQNSYLDLVKTEIEADAALLAKINAAYGASGTTVALKIADYWEGSEFNGVKYVQAYPSSSVVAVSFYKEDGTTLVETENVVVKGTEFADVAKNIAEPEENGKTFNGWELKAGGAVGAVVNTALEVKAVYLANDSFRVLTLKKYDVKTNTYVTASTQRVAYNGTKSLAAAAPIYGMNFVGWYYAGDTSVEEFTVSTQVVANMTLYPVYETANVMDEAITTVGDDAAIVSMFGKDDITSKVVSLYTFDNETKTDVFEIILKNLSLALDVVSDKQISVDQIMEVLKDIPAIHIAPEGSTEAQQEANVAAWLRFLLSRADQSRTVKNYYYNVVAVEDTVATLGAALTALDAAANTNNALAITEYMTTLANYTAYYRYLGIYGNLTEEMVTGANNWEYAWTAAQWTAYNAGENAVAKAELYRTTEAAAATQTAKETAVVGYYEDVAMDYIEAYLGVNRGEYDTIQKFLFGKDATDAGLSASIDFGRNATKGLWAKLTLKRGAVIVADIEVNLGFTAASSITAYANTVWSADALDFRAWDMNKIALYSDDALNVAVDTTAWTVDEISAFSTACVIDGDAGTITYGGTTYYFDAANTQFQSMAVSALQALNEAMVG